MKNVYRLFFTFSFIALFSISVFAMAETHDGFYFNALLGGGYDKSTVQQTTGEEEFSGIAYMFKLKIGGAPVENFIVYGVFGFYDLESPKYKQGSVSETLNGEFITYNEIGLGACYYFMPDNIYISTDLTATQMGMGNNSDSKAYNSETGWSFTLSIGKEWWVSENWGLGFALIGTAGMAKAGEHFSDDKNEKIIHTYFGAALSATYN